MFERDGWQDLNHMIDLMADAALVEIHDMAEHARESIGRRFAFFNRSRGQRARWARQRRIKGVKA